MILAAVLLLAAALGSWRLLRIAEVGAGYKAKVLGSAVFVSGRSPESALAEDVSADKYRIMRLFRAEVDGPGRTVTTSLLGLRPRQALFRPGLGVTLVPTGRPALLEPSALPEAPPLPPGPWPGREPEEPRPGPAPLGKVLERSLGEPAPARLRRTRAAVVVRGGRLLAERYAPGFGPRTRLCGWSMTKTVMSALVGVLVGEGRLSLQSRALLPQWRAPGDPRAAITLDDLLRMRSGLAFAEVYSDPLSDVTRMLFASPGAADFAAAKRLRAAPGQSWAYASGTTNIVSRVVRGLFDRQEDYLAFPRRALFGPLGMSSAVMEPDAAGDLVASSFMYATARDWARFGLLYARDGVWDGRRVLPEGWVDYSRTPTEQSPDGRYGAHWWLKLTRDFGGETEAARRIPADAFHALGHEGQIVTVIPSLDLVVVRLGLAVYVDAWDHAAFLAEILDAL
ncbi:MAG: serine hydrolase [Elusimicrobia bacterium]|nr:serine hydrolase [Elusimicrobiota bacterium]